VRRLRLDGLEITVQYVWVEVVAVGPNDRAQLGIDPDPID
jgi:hypothetical protein